MSRPRATRSEPSLSLAEAAIDALYILIGLGALGAIGLGFWRGWQTGLIAFGVVFALAGLASPFTKVDWRATQPPPSPPPTESSPLSPLAEGRSSPPRLATVLDPALLPHLSLTYQRLGQPYGPEGMLLWLEENVSWQWSGEGWILLLPPLAIAVDR